jgi:hypothetical protein
MYFVEKFLVVRRDLRLDCELQHMTYLSPNFYLNFIAQYIIESSQNHLVSDATVLSCLRKRQRTWRNVPGKK